MSYKATDLAYIAGIFDSKGSVHIETPKEAERCALYVWITAKDFALMEYLQRFGAKVGQKEDGQYRAKWRNNVARTLLKAILPWLKTKAEQATIGVEFYNNLENGAPSERDVTFRLRLKLQKRAEEQGGPQ